MIYFCAQAVCKVLFSCTFPTQKKIKFYIIWVLDVPEGVKFLWVTESFRQFCALVSLANIFRWKACKICENVHWPPRFTKLNYTVLWLYYTGCTQKTPKKTYPSQSSCNPLDAIIVSHVHNWTTRPLPKFRAAKPTQQIASREQIELHPHLKEISPPQYHIYIDNTFRACGKDSPEKKPRARLIYITIRVNQI